MEMNAKLHTALSSLPAGDANGRMNSNIAYSSIKKRMNTAFICTMAVQSTVVTIPSLSPLQKKRSSFFSCFQHFQTARRHRLILSSVPNVWACSLTPPSSLPKDYITSNGGKVSSLIDFSKVETRSKRGLWVSTKERNKVLEGTELVSLSEALLLTPQIARKILEGDCAGIKNAEVSIGDEAILAIGILYERCKGNESSFGPLIGSLPDVGQLDCPNFWTEEQLDMLRGSPLYEKSVQVRTGIKEEWERLNEGIFRMDRECFPEDMFCLRFYEWAVGIVDSRCLYASSGLPLLLAPVLQSLNPPAIGEKATVRVEVTGGAFFAKRKVMLYANRDMKDGEELTVSFGEGVRNSEYLVERGLIVESNGINDVDMSFELSTLDKLYEDKVDILEMNEISTSPTFSLLSVEKNRKWEGPENLNRFLRLMCLTGEDSFLLEGIFRREVWDIMGLPVSAKNEKAVYNVMTGACADAMDSYTWRFAEDEGEEVGEEEGKNEMDVQRIREGMARTVVREEKQILKCAKDSYSKASLSLDALEYYAERRLKELDLLRPIDDSEIVDSDSGVRLGRAFDENY